jgi:two-component system, LytTR family, response regulator
MRPTDLRILIVDDEPLARSRIRELLAADSRVATVVEARNGAEAVRIIRDLGPDLVFLDIQMPRLDGFGVIDRVGVERMPPVVFVTAYDQYALRAFDVQAVDYLLKPFTKERFARAWSKALAGLATAPQDRAVGETLRALLDRMAQPAPLLDRIAVSVNDRIVPVQTTEIDWIEAAGKHLVLHAGRHRHVVRESMLAIETRLDPRRFVRIHRGRIVNLDRVVEIQRMFHGACTVVLRDGTRLPLGRRYRGRFEVAIGL